MIFTTFTSYEEVLKENKKASLRKKMTFGIKLSVFHFIAVPEFTHKWRADDCTRQTISIVYGRHKACSLAQYCTLHNSRES